MGIISDHFHIAGNTEQYKDRLNNSVNGVIILLLILSKPMALLTSTDDKIPLTSSWVIVIVFNWLAFASCWFGGKS